MKVLDNQPTVFFDVDETLVLWRAPLGWGPDPIEIKMVAHEHMLVWPHEAHIERLKNHARLGHQVVVWSHGGVDWARAVVERLDLTAYVDVVCNKGSWFYDDKPQDIITQYTQRYINPGAVE